VLLSVFKDLADFLHLLRFGVYPSLTGSVSDFMLILGPVPEVAFFQTA
jgi:hypothetical protein